MNDTELRGRSALWVALLGLALGLLTQASDLAAQSASNPPSDCTAGASNEAHYACGVAAFQAGHYRDAASYFLKVYQSDHSGSYAPDSLLYLADAMWNVHDRTRTCIALEEFASTYALKDLQRLRAQFQKIRERASCFDVDTDEVVFGHKSGSSVVPKGSDGESASALDMRDAKRKCATLGFVRGTPKFGQCVLQITE